jgi:hypothetical protein
VQTGNDDRWPVFDTTSHFAGPNPLCDSMDIAGRNYEAAGLSVELICGTERVAPCA